MNAELTIDGSVAWVTINRVDRMNAIDAQTDQELEQIWTQIEADPSLRCVVLTGAGDRAFCAGADLKSNSGQTGVEYWTTQNPNGFGGISLRQSLTIPVIARVNGYAVGGGMEMVLGCDIVIATEDAFFGLPEAKVGRLPLDGGMVLLQRLIPQKIAAGLMMTGRMMPSTEAASYGLVNKVVPRGELDKEVASWVADILACAPLSIAAIKHTIQNTAQLSPGEAQSLKSPSLIAALSSEDAIEGVLAFKEKRAPNWRGQ